MSYVNISFGAAVSNVIPSPVGIACLIGTTVADVGVINNVTQTDLLDTTNLPTGTGTGQLAVGDALYKAAIDYFISNPTGQLVLVGIDIDASHSVVNSAMTKVDDTNWISQFSPVSSWDALTDGTAKLRIKLTAAGAEEAEVNYSLTGTDVPDTATPGTVLWDTDTWYFVLVGELFEQGATQDGGASVQLDKVNGSLTGGITFVDDDATTLWDANIRIGQVDDGSIDSWVSYASIASMLCKATPPNFGYYMKDMTGSSVDFDAFAIAYDAEKLSGDGVGERYGIADCPSGVGWYTDFVYGCAMATQLLGAGQRCVFFSEVPLNASYGGSLDAYDAANNGKTSDLMHVIVGSNELVTTFHSFQDNGGSANQISSGIAGMGDFLGGTFRETMTFRSSLIPADNYPTGPVSSLWQDIRVNPFIQIRATGTTVWGSNWTHGTGNGQFLNFVMCRNILANKIEEALYTLLFTRTLHIDLPSMERIKTTIRNVVEAYSGIYCDAFSSVTIPLEGYIRNGNTTEVDAAKVARTVGAIQVAYEWNGDVEFINITGLYGV